ncbi:MAG: ATP-binding protein [Hydrogenophaga sp.]|uniref:DNA glycosylase AlkZ-like family protein n=1 Tax=Hydrogenophaga sp. TaxID=1904254 RepID=UPI002724CBAE|nr:crosslink repair DNA glycosylase YcaQ family protein [Hydrogenophaga sp.]MDO9569834.1 ATP-binding protein [Hydrogenophaga sp.]MDP3376057.1 ATP-binding protein [Hydrogenophaga sp.]
MKSPSLPKTETLEVEFKSDRDCLNDDDLIEALIGLANAQGGTLYLGVENDGTVTGLHRSRPADFRSVAALVANRTFPSLQAHVESQQHQQHRVAAITVQRSPDIVARSDGLVKRRRMNAHGQPECVPFLPHEYASRRADFQMFDMSSEVMADATVADFDPLQRERLRAVIANNPRSDKSLVGLTDEQLEGALCLTVTRAGTRHPTLLGLLLIGRTDSLRRMVPTHEVLFQVLDGTRVKVNEGSRAALIEIVEWLDLLSRGVNTEQEFNEGLFRIGIARVDVDALREAINNALVHRDYARRGPVRVCWQKDDLIISNPGGFVEGVSLANLLTTEPRPRNPALADAFKRLGLVDRTGRGVDMIYTNMLRFGRPAPDYAQSMPDLVKLSISTEAADLAFVRMVLQEEARQKSALPVETLLVLTALREARRLSASDMASQLQTGVGQAAKLMEALAESGLARAHGSGRSRYFTLSPAVYRNLGQQVEYVRQAAFEPIQRVQMIKNYLRENGQIRRHEAADLCQLSPREAGAVLERMVKNGDIVLHGVRKTAFYTLRTEPPV